MFMCFACVVAILMWLIECFILKNTAFSVWVNLTPLLVMSDDKQKVSEESEQVSSIVPSLNGN
ncbi:hypothetical protein JHK82_031900 [Glycine max]|nr:hypothetical protein JHK87_031831 [Glycine soja]KAG4989580.1 hypothetical protein JHK85_032563 [Glycine max]KAG4995170.1 hypothetical protein JHK86_031997 [Glycine max]KAG5125163.1 hypothetical protein JHK82_031900 [Glycine max]KAG5146588.1 hypothetical protein JHK84_032131 [Glycine max]